jgi:hypothetical protein
MRLTLVVFLGILLSCSPPDLDTFAQKQTTREERTFATNYLHLLSAGQLDSAAALLAPHLRTDTVAKSLKGVSVLLRDVRLDSLHLIGVNVFNDLGTHSRQVNLNYELPTTSGRWLTASVATRSAGGHTSVIGFSTHLERGRLEELNAFTLAGKSFRHYLWLLLAGLMPIVTIATAIRVVRAKGMPRRWLWALVALIASPAFTLNWTTGQTVLSNNLFVLFGAAFVRPAAAAAWSVTFALPIGAFVAYLRFRAWRNVRSA